MTRLKQIRKIVEEYTPVKDLSIRSRQDKIPIYRGMFFKLARMYSNAPFMTISAELKMDHATVKHWCKNLDNIIKFDPELKAVYNKLELKVKYIEDNNKVVIESPYAGDIDRNLHYARQCLLDSLNRGEYPIASHLLYTQVLDDTKRKQRKKGITAGLVWASMADKTVVYTDYGISEGMKQGIEDAKKNNREIIYRELKK